MFSSAQEGFKLNPPDVQKGHEIEMLIVFCAVIWISGPLGLVISR